jgi:hypothetical protein
VILLWFFGNCKDVLELTSLSVTTEGRGEEGVARMVVAFLSRV